jgi:signal transduction histidine kinase
MSTLAHPAIAPGRGQRWLEQAWALLGGVSVRTKILGIVLALTVVLGLGITWQVRKVMQRVFISELENRGVSVTSDLAGRSVDPILLNDTFALYRLLTETVANHPDALYAFMLDDNGHVLAHTFGEQGFPTDLLDSGLTSQATPHGNGAITHLLYNSAEGLVHEFSTPIVEGHAGAVRLGLTERRLTGIINLMTGQLLLTTLVVALAGIAAAMLLTWLLTRPIIDLVATTQQVGQGDLNARAPHWADDEIGALADAFNQMVSALAVSQQVVAEKELARTRLLQKLINAQEDERKRIARELHDGVGQVLISLIVGAKTAAQVDNIQVIHAKNVEMCRVATETLEQVRMLSRQLRPSLLDDSGLTAALERYRQDFAQLHPTLAVELHCDLPERLPALLEVNLYRIVQEAMTNAARHSQASTISVLVFRREGRVQAIIEDNGSGFDPEQARKAERSVGIHGMIERAELLGGQLNIESNAEGTSIYVEVPYEKDLHSGG